MSAGVPGRWQRILLVDDDPDVAALVTIALGRLDGARVDVCPAAHEAVERARALRPDLILLDVMMPGRDGPATLSALRADPATASIPVVFVSAGAGAGDEPVYRELGALGVIPKPFDPVRLPETLRALCSGERAGRAYPRVPAALHGEYLSELPEKLDAMRSLAAALAAGGWHRPTAETLMQMAHRLAGSSGLYGMGEVSGAAGILEAMLKRALDAPWPPARPPSDVATLVRAVARGAAVTSPGGPGTSWRRSSTRRGSGTAKGSR